MARAQLTIATVGIACLLAVSVSFSACEPLRKKFTRQKKKDAADMNFVPVLEPQDYPAPEKNPAEMYKQHYTLIKVWYKDLWIALDERGSDKQQKYLLKQIHNHIDEMRKLVVPAEQAQLDELVKLLSYYDSAFDAAAPLRNTSRIHSDLRAFDRLLRSLRVDKVKGDFVPVQ